MIEILPSLRSAANYSFTDVNLLGASLAINSL